MVVGMSASILIRHTSRAEEAGEGENRISDTRQLASTCGDFSGKVPTSDNSLLANIP
jgi:hypothetical protein